MDPRSQGAGTPRACPNARNAAVLPQPSREGTSSAVKPDGGIVGRDPQFPGSFRDRSVVEVDQLKDRCIAGLDPLGQHETAATAGLVRHRLLSGPLQKRGRAHHSALAPLTTDRIRDDVAMDPKQPRVQTAGIAQRLSPLKCPHCRRLKDVVDHRPHNPARDERAKRRTQPPQTAGNEVGTEAS